MDLYNKKPSKNNKVPTKFKAILTDLIKEILINKPNDIIEFCANYFKIKQEEFQINLNRSTTFPVAPPNNNGFKKSLSINKKKIVTKKSTCKKNWDKTEDDNNNNQTDNNNSEQKEEECSIFECLNFEDKEKKLNNLRNSDKPINANAENYYNKCFVPYKKYNELLVIAQKAIMSYYLNKGTEKENEFSQMNNEIESKINELNDEFLTKDLESMQILDAINIFKKKNYYVRMLKCYLLKIKLLKNNIFESNELIEEMCYFIFVPEFKTLSKFKESLTKEGEKERKESLNDYFNCNIKLLMPELFSFVYSCKYLDDDSITCIFSDFSVRKRDLSLNYMKQLIIPSNMELSRILTDLQMKIYISTPEQVLKAIDSAQLKKEDKDEEIESIDEKIKQNNPNLSLFINKIINIPFEAIDNNINEFTELKNTEREIVLKYLKLSTDFSDIYNKFNNVKIDQDESNFFSVMKTIYFNTKYIPDLDFMSNCIFNNHLYKIPISVQNFLKNINDSNSEINEEQMIQDFKNLSFLAQSGLYLYLVLKKKEKQNLEGLVNKLRYVKEKYESLLYRTHIEAVLKNFTHNSDEIKVFKERYNKWKENLSKDLVEILEKESEDDMEEIFKNIKDDLHKKIVFNILVIEGLLENNKKLKAFVDKLRKNFPTADESNIK
jgi:hypothetical protein